MLYMYFAACNVGLLGLRTYTPYAELTEDFILNKDLVLWRHVGASVSFRFVSFRFVSFRFVSFVYCPWDQLRANRQSSVHANSSQYTTSERKTIPNESTTCTWFTLTEKVCH